MLISRPGTHTLTADVAGPIIITADNVTLNLNGHTVRGSGSGIGISSTRSNITVTNGEVTGFATGIHLNGTGTVTSNEVSRVDVHDCSFMGILVGNAGSTITNCDVWNIGGQTSFGFVPSFGVVTWGRNSRIADTNVWNIRGKSESVAFGFNAKDNTGSVIENCTADGLTSIGWSFGFWNSGGSVKVINTRLSNWDVGIGAAGATTVTGSRIEKVGFINNGLMLDGGANTLKTLPINNAEFIVGTDRMDTLVGGAGANTIFAVGGNDHLGGRGGADVFMFRRGDANFQRHGFRPRGGSHRCVGSWLRHGKAAGRKQRDRR